MDGRSKPNQPWELRSRWVRSAPGSLGCSVGFFCYFWGIGGLLRLSHCLGVIFGVLAENCSSGGDQAKDSAKTLVRVRFLSILKRFFYLKFLLADRSGFEPESQGGQPSISS